MLVFPVLCLWQWVTMAHLGLCVTWYFPRPRCDVSRTFQGRAAAMSLPSAQVWCVYNTFASVWCDTNFFKDTPWPCHFLWPRCDVSRAVARVWCVTNICRGVACSFLWPGVTCHLLLLGRDMLLPLAKFDVWRVPYFCRAWHVIYHVPVWRVTYFCLAATCYFPWPSVTCHVLLLGCDMLLPLAQCDMSRIFAWLRHVAQPDLARMWRVAYLTRLFVCCWL